MRTASALLKGAPATLPHGGSVTSTVRGVLALVLVLLLVLAVVPVLVLVLAAVQAAVQVILVQQWPKVLPALRFQHRHLQ